jgi:hypothetical protein
VNDCVNIRTALGVIGLCALTLSGAWCMPATAQSTAAPAAPTAPAAVAEPSAETAQPSRVRRATQSARKPARTARRGGERYFIEFRSRYALSYGHTFVVFGKLNARGEIGQIKPDMVAGLHPAGEGPELWTLGHVVPVRAETGWSDGDLEEEYVSARWRIELTEPEYRRVAAFIRQHQKNSPLWHAALYNCNAWTGDIARFMGFQTPFHWLKPQDYINRLRELNTGQQPTLASVDAQPSAAYSSEPSAAYSSGPSN